MIRLRNGSSQEKAFDVGPRCSLPLKRLVPAGRHELVKGIQHIFASFLARFALGKHARNFEDRDDPPIGFAQP